MKKDKCKICRRLGIKLFLKGEKCNSPKCPMVKKAYAPGLKGKRRKRRTVSEYGKELQEKQKMRNWYRLSESQFKKYVKKILNKRGKTENPAELLIQKLESRLDSVVLRLGLASSRSLARQMVSHGHFLVNGKPVNIPSYELKSGDKVSLHPNSKKIANFQNMESSLKNYKSPSWLELDKKSLEGKVTAKPTLEEVAPPVEVSAIFEFYSK